MKPKFTAGRNIAIKIPPHEYDATVRFYQDILGLSKLPNYAPDIVFEFGDKNLWLDKVDGLSHTETWFEIYADDLKEAARYLDKQGVVRRDEIEKLPDNFKGFWITNAAGIIHLVYGE